MIAFLTHLTPSYGVGTLTEPQLGAVARDRHLVTCTSLDVEHEQGMEVFVGHLQLAGQYPTTRG